MLGDLADVQEAVGAGEKLDEGAELREANDFAEIGLADFGAGGDVTNHLQGGIAAGSAGGKDVHSAVFENVNFDAGGFDDGPDFFAARTDEVADLVLGNLQLEEARSVGGNLRTPRAQGLFHGVEDLETGLFRLGERFAHHLNADAENLDVHLQSGNAAARARDLEVHVAVVVFGASDVREDGVFMILANDEAHGNAGAGRLERHAGVHKGERTAADGGHRRGAVGLQNIGDQAHGVRKFLFGRKQVRESALGERPVTDFAPAGTAKELYLTDAEGREVVVQHEALELILREEQVETLHIFLGAKSESGERLGFAARKERGAVNTREQADFASDLADFVEGAAIGTAALVENVVTEDVLAEAFKSALGESALLVHLLLGLFRDSLEDLFLESVDEVVAFLLRMLLGVYRVVETVTVFFLEVLVNTFVEGEGRNDEFLGLELRVKFLDGGDDFLDLRVAELESVRDGFFRNFEGAGFHHDDGFFCAGDDDIHQAFLLVGDGGVDHQLAVEQSDADAGNGLLKRKVRAIRRSRGAGYGNDVGVVLAVRREHHGDNLGFIAPGFGEERAHRAVNQPGSENFFLRGAAFALEETAGNFSGGVGVFAVVHRERNKIAVIHRRGHASGGEDDRVPVARGNSAVGLLCDFSGFEDERPSSDFDGHLVRSGCNCIFRHKLYPLAPHWSGSDCAENLSLFRDGRKEASPSSGQMRRDGLHHEKLRHYFCQTPGDRLRVECVSS